MHLVSTGSRLAKAQRINAPDNPRLMRDKSSRGQHPSPQKLSRSSLTCVATPETNWRRRVISSSDRWKRCGCCAVTCSTVLNSCTWASTLSHAAVSSRRTLSVSVRCSSSFSACVPASKRAPAAPSAVSFHSGCELSRRMCEWRQA